MFVKQVAKSLVHRRDTKEHRAALVILAGQLGHHRVRRKRHEGCAGAAEQGPVKTHAEAVQVEEGQLVNENVAGAPAPDLDRAASLGEEVAVVEERSLGPS